jgi:hypothetical protein
MAGRWRTAKKGMRPEAAVSACLGRIPKEFKCFSIL